MTLDDFYITKTTHQPLETFGHIPLEERIKVIAKAWVFYGGNRVDLYKNFLKIIAEVRKNDGYVPIEVNKKKSENTCKSSPNFNIRNIGEDNHIDQYAGRGL